MLMIEKSHKFEITLKNLDGDPKISRTECNYCEKHYKCYTILNETSNIWSHLKVYKKVSFCGW